MVSASAMVRSPGLRSGVTERHRDRHRDWQAPSRPPAPACPGRQKCLGCQCRLRRNSPLAADAAEDAAKWGDSGAWFPLAGDTAACGPTEARASFEGACTGKFKPEMELLVPKLHATFLTLTGRTERDSPMEEAPVRRPQEGRVWARVQMINPSI